MDGPVKKYSDKEIAFAFAYGASIYADGLKEAMSKTNPSLDWEGWDYMSLTYMPDAVLDGLLADNVGKIRLVSVSSMKGRSRASLFVKRPLDARAVKEWAQEGLKKLEDRDGLA